MRAFVQVVHLQAFKHQVLQPKYTEKTELKHPTVPAALLCSLHLFTFHKSCIPADTFQAIIDLLGSTNHNLAKHSIPNNK
jgi:hypothetical protein